MSKGVDKVYIQEVLEELLDYSTYHFNVEEKHFCNLKSYHHCDHHCSQHEEFIQKVRQFHADFISGKKMLNMDIFVFLKDWVNQHIRQVDRGYREVILKRQETAIRNQLNL
jgi:hemerythrin-like metal-binding protein